MKWVNKGHEFDIYAKSLVNNFAIKKRRLYIFGAGIIGQGIGEIISKTKCFAGYIDNDQTKQDSYINGFRVISWKEYLDNGKNGIIIIAATPGSMAAIHRQLVEENLKEEKDFYIYSKFMRDVFPVLSVYANNQFYVELAQICLTERCTLKCKKCAHGCYAVTSDTPDMSFETAKESADYFFENVDIVNEFVLIGGEPLLYQKLNEIIEYIGSKYREQIVVFSITTNGTLPFKESTLDLCKKYNVTIRISNYSGTIRKLKSKYLRLKEQLENRHVLYTLSKEPLEWVDLGFESGDRGREKGELLNLFDECKTPCREIRGNRFYYCVMARSVSDNLKIKVGENDYLDLNTVEGRNKKILLEFQLGFSQKGYLDMCGYCNGSEAFNHPIPAAEQLNKK